MNTKRLKLYMKNEYQTYDQSRKGELSAWPDLKNIWSKDAEKRQTFLELHEDFVQISNNYNTKDVKNTINAMEWFD